MGRESELGYFQVGSICIETRMMKRDARQLFRKNIPDRGNRFKGSKVGTSLVLLRNKSKTTMAGEKQTRERTAGNRWVPDPTGVAKSLDSLTRGILLCL
jgi:hypothetical protein